MSNGVIEKFSVLEKISGDTQTHVVFWPGVPEHVYDYYMIDLSYKQWNGSNCCNPNINKVKIISIKPGDNGPDIEEYILEDYTK